MDESKYCELEAKYDASILPVSDFQAAMAALGGTFKTVVGLDTFFSDTKKVLRYRRCRPFHENNPVDRAALTYKQRRRNGDISDRTEVDLWLGDKATEQDVRAMMEAMGMKESFTITKESWIQHVNGDSTISSPNVGSGSIVGGYFQGGIGTGTAPGNIIWGPPYTNYPDPFINPGPIITVTPALPKDRIDAVFALYDVIHEGKIRRFLEVEMERSGLVSDESAIEKLKYWKDWISQMWPRLGNPLQTSLYEMFAPHDDLFVPESF